MQNFEPWFTELCSDEIWFEPASMLHKPETFQALARKVYMQGVAEGYQKPMREARKHVYNLVCKAPSDKVRVDWVKKALEKKAQEDAAKEPEWKPASPEHVDKCVAEFDAMLKKSPMMNAVPRLTAKELIEKGDWRVALIEPRTEVYKAMVLTEHIEKVREARRKVFRQHFPDAVDAEVEAYIQKFEDRPINI